jgi:hypothetical protein
LRVREVDRFELDRYRQLSAFRRFARLRRISER